MTQANLTDADEPTLADAEERIEAWLHYKEQGRTVESYELKCLLVVYAELKALRERCEWQRKALSVIAVTGDQYGGCDSASLAEIAHECLSSISETKP